MGRLDDIARRNRRPRGRWSSLSVTQAKWLLIGCAVVMLASLILMVMDARRQQNLEEQRLTAAATAAGTPDHACSDLGRAIDRVEIALKPARSLPAETAHAVYCSTLQPAVTLAGTRAGDRAIMRELVRKLEHFSSACEKIAVADSQQALAVQVDSVRKRVAGMCPKR